MDIKIILAENQVILKVPPEMSGRGLKVEVAAKFSIPKDQISLFFVNDLSQKINIEDSSNIEQLGLTERSRVIVKNLGKQISWKNVFYIEYLGPILIVPAFYFFGKKHKYTLVHQTAALMSILHFAKREIETKFVHVFSHQTMPFKRVFINSAHYWILFGLLNSIELFLFPKATKWDSNDIVILFLIWAFMEFCNLKCHLELSSFRKTNPKGRGIPKNWGFKFVSCANYLWETLGWLTFSILTKCVSSFLFTAVSVAQMASWALKKHKAYKKEFGVEYPKERKAIFPFIL